MKKIAGTAKKKAVGSSLSSCLSQVDGGRKKKKLTSYN
jgi:hypothetical protein